MNFPPIWSVEQLEIDRLRAKQIFREERMREPLKEYLDQFENAREAFDKFLETTVDLTQLSEKALDIVSNPRLLTALRYLPGPPISLDDLKVLTETTLAPKFLRSDATLALAIVKTILLGIDRRRFPWLAPGEEREPTVEERSSAILASAAILATRRVETIRRNLGKQNQEQKVKDTLSAASFGEVKITRIEHLSKAPKPGQFCNETRLGSKKADIVVGLWDLRTMGVECKVSNSAVNSIKRLNHDAVAKAKMWRDDFGNQIVPVAVLSGVFDLVNLKLAQASGIFLFWSHDLEKLLDWIETTRPGIRAN